MSGGQEFYLAFIVGAVVGPLLYGLLAYAPDLIAVVRGGGRR